MEAIRDGSYHLGVVVNLGEGKREPATLSRILALTAADMGRVNELILSKAGSDVEMIPEIANHLISSGGKRLRPMVTLAAAQMFGYSRATATSSSPPASSSCIPPRSSTTTSSTKARLRRGKKTARMIWGNQASVLVGDFLLGQAFRMMVDVGSLDALDILSSAASVIAEGEVMQLAAAKNLETTEDEHFAGDQGEDGGACSRPRRKSGPVIAGRPCRTEKAALRSYGSESRPRLPADRRRARLWRLQLEGAGQERRRRFPRGQGDASGHPQLTGAARRMSGRSGRSAIEERQDPTTPRWRRPIGLMTRPRSHRRHDRPGAAFRRNRPRCAGPAASDSPKDRIDRRDRFLHQSRQLTDGTGGQPFKPSFPDIDWHPQKGHAFLIHACQRRDPA
jgi:hypothetical protein